jgi:tripartite-type tricarboxylate transporter receptor subunit TctC
LPGYEVGSWFGLCAPAATPKAVVDKTNADLNAALGTPETQQRILGLGAQPLNMTPEQFSRFVGAEIAKWSKVVKDSGATAQ